MAGREYRPEIDGLRALAVVAVVLFHLGLGFPGGFLGVDVFFVISGFLITGIIRRGLEAETFSLAEFWERRIRRIFPALFVVLVATLATGYWLLLPNELEELGKSSVAQALLLANVYFWRDTGYFAGPAELKPLLHTWSLAVEEQFYLFFPLVMVGFRKLSAKRLFALFALAAVVSFAGSVYGVIFHSNAAFFLLPSRAWELLTGCMLAVFPWQSKSAPRRDSALATIGLLSIVLPIFLYDSNTPFPGLAAAPPVFGTAMIIFATASTPSLWLVRILSLRPVVFVGLISYSLYLWHWPVIVYARMYFEDFGWKEIVFAVALSLCLATLSWKCVETPLRQSFYLKKRRRLFGCAFALSCGMLAVSFAFVKTRGVKSRFPNLDPVLLDDMTWHGGNVGISIDSLDFASLPALGVELGEEQIDARLDFLLWGDSHAAVMSEVVDQAATQHDLSGKVICAGAQVPLLGVCTPLNGTPEAELRFRRQILEIIKTKRPKNLILVCRWSWYTDGFSKVERLSAGREHLHTNSPFESATPEKNLKVLTEGLKDLVESCEENDVTLWVVKEVPEAGGKLPARDALVVAGGRRDRLPDYSTTLSEHLVRQEKTRGIFSEALAPGTQVVDPAPYLFDNQNLIVFDKGRSLYQDSDHLTRYGAQRLSELFNNIMQEIAERTTFQTQATTQTSFSPAAVQSTRQ